MKLLRWVVSNAVFAALLAAGVMGVGWAGNVVVFVTWAFAVLLMFSVFIVFLASFLPNDKRPPIITLSVPKWVDVTYDLTVILVLAGFGWFVTAAGWTLCTMLQHFAYAWQRVGRDDDDDEDEEDDEEPITPLPTNRIYQPSLN